MTSMRRSSLCSGRAMSRSRIRTFVETRPPASRQTLAAALSSAEPRRSGTPTFAHAARWWVRIVGGATEPEATEEEHWGSCTLNREWKPVGQHMTSRPTTRDFLGTSTWPCSRLGDAATQMWPRRNPPSSRLRHVATHVWARLALRFQRHLYQVSRHLPTVHNDVRNRRVSLVDHLQPVRQLAKNVAGLPKLPRLRGRVARFQTASGRTTPNLPKHLASSSC